MILKLYTRQVIFADKINNKNQNIISTVIINLHARNILNVKSISLNFKRNDYFSINDFKI